MSLCKKKHKVETGIYTYTCTQINQLASIRRASAWIDVPDFASVLTVTGGRVADLSPTFVGCEWPIKFSHTKNTKKKQKEEKENRNESGVLCQ